MTLRPRPIKVKSRSGRHPASLCLAVCCALASLCAPAQQPVPAHAESAKSDAEIIRGIDDAVSRRTNAISTYSVQEQYSVYRNGESAPSAQETIHTVYTRSIGKEYTPIAQSGSSFLRAAVIDKVLAGEKDLNPANRDGALITSKNYEFQPQPGIVDLNGHPCILVVLRPRRKSPHLFTGKMWIDPSDSTIVRLEGAPSQSPSVFAGQATVARDYIKIDGFSMATHAEARSHTFLFGDTLLKIDYTSYQIQQDPAAK
jgi:hypothetical protein